MATHIKRVTITALVLLALAGLVIARGALASAAGVAAIATGGNHTCALTDTDGAKCWGSNQIGQLGDDGTCGLICTTPTDVAGLSSGVTAMVAGTYHSCALMSAGGAKCWGSDSSGQLGDDTTGYPSCECRPTPVDVVGLTSGVKALAVGRYHTCALTQGGGVKCWGSNNAGQLGDGTTTSRTTAVDVVGLSAGVAAISAGAEHTCALTTAGGVKCWGSNEFPGRLGDGTNTNSSTPVDVVGLSSGVVAVDAGDFHTCAVTTTGGVKCWGYNLSGELGNGTSGPYAGSSVPVDVCQERNAVTLECVQLLTAGAVSAGSEYTCAVPTAGGAKCWGYNIYGKLGDGTLQSRSIAVDVVGLTTGVAAVVAGGEHTCALTTTRETKCWGYNYYGQLGVVTGDCKGTGTSCSSTPVDVLGIKPTPTPCPPEDCPTHTPVVTPEPTATATRADVNCDGQVNSIDAALVLQRSAGLILSMPCSQNGDVNHDGSVNAIDAALILQYAAGLTHSLP